jgi:hypothetical protein
MAKKVVPVAVVEADVEMVSKPGLGIDEGIVLTTFFFLLGAIALVFIANGTYTP